MSYNRLVLSGTLASGAEIWSTGVNFTNGIGPLVISQEDLQAWADNVAQALTSGGLGTELLDGLGATSKITKVTVYFYASNTGPSTFVAEAAMDRAGVGTNNLPLPTSMVISLKTAFAGRSYRGRMYWPALGNTVQVGGTFSSSFMNVIATEAANLLNTLSGEAPGTSDLIPAVVSKTRDVVTPVTSVSIGNVPDTQRRRRNGLIETYATAPI